MSASTHNDLAAYAESLSRDARRAGRSLAVLSGKSRNDALLAMARLMRERSAPIIAANAQDLAAAKENKLTDAMIDRLRLDAARLDKMAQAVEEVAAQVDPVGETISACNRPNGLRVEKRRVPIGVVAIIYEARPNVTSDAASLCLKSGNACILRGGKESIHSNLAIGKVIGEALESCGIDPKAVQVVQTTDRTLVPLLVKRDQDIDLVIPRGGESLIRSVVAESSIPVLKHYTGNCHVYVHDKASADMAEKIVLNAKLQRPGVCNAAETILVDAGIAEALLPRMARKLMEGHCEVRGCDRTLRLVPEARPASEQDWYTEYLDLIVAIKVVDGLEAAIDHINTYGSHHTDAIVTNDLQAADRFVASVDSSSVIVNCSTRMSDGGVYGLGAEIGISTDKLHARGPMGAADLTTYKYIVSGPGLIRT
jgi:glutamate-5-semialdehyde dehydrogenase